ncbi:MAG: hypothetical protein QM755_03120 [Luteolibacter sp.]
MSRLLRGCVLLPLVLPLARAVPQIETVSVFGVSACAFKGPFTRGADGSLYGTGQAGANASGTFFRITPEGGLRVMGTFNWGNKPLPELEQDPSSPIFYGTTFTAPANYGGVGGGSVYRVWQSSGVPVTLHTFTAYDGGEPSGGVTRGSDGNLYGTTRTTVFKLTPQGDLTTLYTFTGRGDGTQTIGGLTSGNDGNFYGVTSLGGPASGGTIFRITPEGQFTTLFGFTGSDGSMPGAGLTLGEDGALYGTTMFGGDRGVGTAFRITTGGTFTTLAHFGGSLGKYPRSRLTRAANGSFYGATEDGGLNDDGTIFSMSANGTVTTMAEVGSIGGLWPESPVMGADGNLYGPCQGDHGGGLGLIYRLTPQGVLTKFYDSTSGVGEQPEGNLVQGPDGNFYGTTRYGGQRDSGMLFKATPEGEMTQILQLADHRDENIGTSLVFGADGAMYGTIAGSGYLPDRGGIFRVTTRGEWSTFASFTGQSGFSPWQLIHGWDGNFYGTTGGGGSAGRGVVFKMTADGTLSTLASFPGGAGASAPGGGFGLLLARDGTLYGTSFGGTGKGVVYKVTTEGVLSTVAEFTDDIPGPGSALAPLMEGSDGNLYGTTYYGGSANGGTLFRLTPSGELTRIASLPAYTGSSQPPIETEDGTFLIATRGGPRGYGGILRVSTDGTCAEYGSAFFFDMEDPNSPFLLGRDGNLYGTTYKGGRDPDNELLDGGALYRLRIGPRVDTGEAQGLAPDSATVSGKVTGSGWNVTTSFEYSSKPDLSSSTIVSSGVVAGADNAPISATLTGLQPRQTYYYRAIATTDFNPAPLRGKILSFTTPSDLEYPWVETQSAQSVSARAATLTGLAYAGGWDVSTFFEYSTDPEFTTSDYVGFRTLSGDRERAFSTRLTNLEPGRTYYYRALVTGRFGEEQLYGDTRSFTTQRQPNKGAAGMAKAVMGGLRKLFGRVFPIG